MKGLALYFVLRGDMMADFRHPLVPLTPSEIVLAKRLLKFLVPLMLIALFMGSFFAGMYLVGWLLYLCFFAVRWGIREDRKAKIANSFEKGFLDELKDIEKRVVGDKPKEDKGLIKNSKGDVMFCILCDKPVNKNGYFCAEHDEGQYKRP